MIIINFSIYLALKSYNQKRILLIFIMLDNREYHYYDLDINEEYQSQEFNGVSHWEMISAKVGKIISLIILLVKVLLFVRWI